MVRINKDNCIGCLKCISVCPFTVLKENEGKARVQEEKMCLNCMHCAIACESGAISCNGKAAVLEKKPMELPDNFAELLESHLMVRRSYRHFSAKPVERDVLNHALEVASWAPSAKNQQKIKYVVVDSKETIEKIMKEILDFAKETGAIPEIVSEYNDGNNPVLGTAPTLLLAYAPTDSINPLGDTFLKLSYIELILQAQGIGTCFAGYLTRLANNVPALSELFALPEGTAFFGALMMGYPQGEEYTRIPERINRQEVRWL